jgi:hypothetical protein
MKYNHYLLAAVLAFAPACVQGAAITISNITFAGNDLAVLDNSGTPLSGGFIALFDFSGGAPTDFATLQANGNNGLISSTILGGGNNPAGGAISTQFGPNNSSGALNGVNLFVVIGNGADVASSTNLGILDGARALSTSDTPLPEAITLRLNTGLAATLGTIDPTRSAVDWGPITGGNPPGAGYTTATFTLDAIPEPSSSLLAGLAGIALLIRRRR